MNLIGINIDNHTISISNHTIQYKSFSDHNVAVTEVLTESQIWALISHENSSNSFNIADDKFASLKLSDPKLSIKEKTYINDLHVFLSNSSLTYKEFNDRVTNNISNLTWIDRLRLINQLELIDSKINTKSDQDIIECIFFNVGIHFMFHISSENYK